MRRFGISQAFVVLVLLLTAFPSGAAQVQRRIDDLLALLRDPALTHSEWVRKRKADALAPIPSDVTVAVLERRGAAARDAGLYSLAKQYYSMVFSLDRDALDKTTLLGHVYYGLAVLERNAGRYDESLNLYKMALKNNPIMVAKPTEFHAIWSTEYAAYLAMAGDVAAAKRVLSDAYFAVKSRAENTRLMNWTLLQRYPLACLEKTEAVLLEAEGKSADAEARWRKSVDLLEGLWDAGTWYESSGIFSHYLTSLTYLSRNLRLQGKLAEGEDAAHAAVMAAIRFFGSNSVFAVQSLGELREQLIAQNRLEEAGAVATAADVIANSIEIGDDSLFKALTIRAQAEISLLQGKWQEASNHYRRLDVFAASSPRGYDAYIASDPGQAMAMAFSGDPASALPLLERRLAKLEALKESRYERAELRGLLGVILALLGQDADALNHLREGVPVLLAANTGERSAVASARLRWIAEALAGLLRRLPSDQRAALADTVFQAAEQSRGGSLQATISAAAARAAVQGDMAEAVRRQQDIAMHVASLRDMLLRAQVALPDDRALHDGLRADLARLEDQRDVLSSEIAAAFPAYYDLAHPRPPTMAQFRRILVQNEAALVISVGEQQTQVWSMSRDREPVFASVDVGKEEIRALVASIRATTAFRGDSFDSIPAFDLAAAERLYRLLLEPVRDGWQGSRNLVVIADGSLGFLPFALLLTEMPKPVADKGGMFERYRQVKWLGRSHAVFTVPSTAALVSLRRMQVGQDERKPFAGFGDPVFGEGQETTHQMAAVSGRGGLRHSHARTTGGGSLDDARIHSARLAELVPLSETADEVRDVARALGAVEDKDVFLGAAASEDVVKTTVLADRKVVMFATHGLVAGDLDGLTQPALALSNPAVTGGSGDGLLTMEEVLGLKLDADWVVLSACNTAAAAGAGAEAVSGLGRAFFYAGTRAVLVTHWPVETESARRLTNEVFRRQAADPSLSRAEVLRQAMMAVMDGPGVVENGKTIATYAHPVFWAPFALVGDGG